MAKNVPKIGLALGGGGVRAFVHLGIYEVLQENEIPIAMVAGTSMGAIIGASIALGHPVEAIKRIAYSYEDLNLVSLSNFNYFDESLFKREEIDKILKITFGYKTFGETKIPFRCTSIDLETREEVVHDKGLIRQAVAASSAYPPVFAPVFHEGRYLIDGGAVDLVPAGIVREFGVDKLIAVRLDHYMIRQYISGEVFKRHYLPNTPVDNAPWYKRPFYLVKRKKNDLKLVMDILLENASIAASYIADTKIEQAKPDLILRPEANIGLLEFSKLDDAIKIGRQIAEENLEVIKSWLK